MSFRNGKEKDSDPVFDRLPPAVKREFLAKRTRDAAQAEAYEAEHRKICIKGAIIGGLVGFGLGLVMGMFSLILATILGLAEAGAGYLVVSRKLGHYTSMGIFASAAILLPLITGTAVFSVTGFIFLLGGWGFAASTGGCLGYWARMRETRSQARLD